MLTRLFPFLICSLFVCTNHLSAQTEDEEEISESEQRASELNLAARDAFEEGNFSDAITLFEQAFEEYPDPAFAENLAQLHDNKNHLPQALEYYQAYLDLFEDAPNREDILIIIEDIQHEIDTQWFSLSITSFPIHVEITNVTDENEHIYLGQTPIELFGPNEVRVYRLEHEGFLTTDLEIQPVPGGEVEHEVTLEQPLREENPEIIIRHGYPSSRGQHGYYLLAGGLALAMGGGMYFASEDADPAVGGGIAGVGVALIIAGIFTLPKREEIDRRRAFLGPLIDTRTVGAQFFMHF